MKQKLYRGTTLQEALNILDDHIPKKYLYRITDQQEAKSYALINKIDDKAGRGAIVSTTLNLPKTIQQKILTAQEYQNLEKTGIKNIIGNSIGIYRTSSFDVIITPPQYHKEFKNIEVIKVL